jgi:rubrerythrin
MAKVKANEWTCSGCGTQAKGKEKPKRCPGCGAPFVDIQELVT